MDGKTAIKVRALLMGAGITLLFFFLLARLFWLQVVEADWLVARAERMWAAGGQVPPERGAILDRNGKELAKNATAYTVVATISPKDEHRVRDPEDAARKLAPVLGMSEDQILDLLTRRDAYQVELRPGGWKIDREKANQVRKLGIPGISLVETTRRYYPNGELAAHVLGFQSLDGKAMGGIEQAYDQALTGTPGTMTVWRDLKRNVLPNGLKDARPPKPGKTVVLTLDEQIQSFVEQALDEAEKSFRPKRMTAIVMDPNTGEVLAMANRPTFNPNRYWEVKDYRQFLNGAVASVFEPGSTFKIITLAAAIEEKLFNPNETYLSGRISGPFGTVRDHNRRGWGRITFLEGVQKSSNVAFVILGYQRLGKERLYQYVMRFGIGEKTGIELPGEVPGLLKRTHQMYPADVANMAFGQGVGVTAIQQAVAVSAIANGGNLLKPHIVKEIRDAETGQVLYRMQPEVRRRVVSEATAKQVRDILETVVTDGTGQPYALDGWRVAGKTGTAQKVGPDGRYLSGKYVYSFIGFAPKDHPRLLVYVVVDEPDVDPARGGGTVVAPIFKTIMRNSLLYLNVPQDKPGAPGAAAPTVQPQQAAQTDGQAQRPAEPSGAANAAGPRGEGDGQTGHMPDLRGLSLRDALAVCGEMGLRAEVHGSGYVVRQSIAPGAPLPKDKRVRLELADFREADEN